MKINMNDVNRRIKRRADLSIAYKRDFVIDSVVPIILKKVGTYVYIYAVF